MFTNKRKIYIVTSYHYNFAKKYSKLCLDLKAEGHSVNLIVYEKALAYFPLVRKNRAFDVIYSGNFYLKSTYSKEARRLALHNLITEIFESNELYIKNVDMDRSRYYPFSCYELTKYERFIAKNMEFFTSLILDPPDLIISEGPNNIFLRCIYVLDAVMCLKLRLITHRLGKLPGTFYIGRGFDGYNPIEREKSLQFKVSDKFVPDYASPDSKLRRSILAKFKTVWKGDLIITLQYILYVLRWHKEGRFRTSIFYFGLILTGLYREYLRVCGQRTLSQLRVDVSVPFWIFPEQFHPEASTSAFCSQLEDDLFIFSKLKQIFPAVKLKPHPSVVGRNGRNSYTKFMPNVLPLDINIELETVIGCVTVNSTLVLEFLKIGKPVICLGKSEITNIFSEFILFIDIENDDISILKAKLQNYMKTRKKCNDAIVISRLKKFFYLEDEVSILLEKEMMVG